MERREFVQFTGLSAGMLVLGRRVADFNGSLTPIPAGDQKALADAALNAARTAGATYAGRVNGRSIQGTVESAGRSSPWTATRSD